VIELSSLDKSPPAFAHLRVQDGEPPKPSVIVRDLYLGVTTEFINVRFFILRPNFTRSR
jgi:hypothetical protein